MVVVDVVPRRFKPTGSRSANPKARSVFSACG
jgi:hypothetical protein